MADRHWVGATNGTWNNTANWSATQGGAGGASVPTTGDDVFIDKAISANSYINVNQDIGAINSLSFTDYSTGNVAWYLGGGTSTTTLGTAWTVPTGITIDVATGTYVLGVLNVTFSGSAPNVVKTGGGGLLRSAPTTGSWGTATFDVQGGWIGASGLTNALGTGAITLANGTGISSATAAVTLGNSLTVNGDIFVNRYLDSTTTALGSLTATGAISLGGSQRTLTVGGTGAANVNAASFTGVISGTAGFIVDGDPTGYAYNTAPLYGLRLTNTGNTVSGNVIVRNVLQMGTPANPPTSSGNVLPSVGNIEIDGTNAFAYIATNASMTTSTFSGNGNLDVFPSSGVVVTFPPNALSNLNNGSSLVGMRFPPYRGGYVDVNDLPSKFTFALSSGSGAGSLRYVATNGSNSTFSTAFVFTGSSYSPIIEANGSAGSSLTLSGTMSGSPSLNLILKGSNTDDNTVSGVISHSTGLTKQDAGKWVLSGTNTYAGANTLTAGILKVTNGSALGAAAGTSSSMASGATLKIAGGITLNKASTAFTNAATIENESGVNTLTFSSMSMSASFQFTVTAGSLDVTNTITTGGVAQTLTIAGPGTLRLSNTGSSYVSATTISSGTVEVTKLDNAAANSSLGAPASGQATITMGANTSLLHVGTTGDTTTRSITFTGGAGTTLTLGSNGTGNGAINYDSAGSLTISGAGAHTLVLNGTNAATNTMARTIADGGSGATAVTKSGSNTWSLTGTISATGLFSISAGSLYFGATSRTLSGGLQLSGGSVSIANGNTIAANTTFTAGAAITAVLTGANTLTVASGCTQASPAILQPDATTGSNSLTGAVAINGCVDLVTPNVANIATAGNGRVLGTSNTVTVSSTGIIRTKTTTSSNQRGRARYNNLTLQAGSAIKIGFAA